MMLQHIESTPPQFRHGNPFFKVSDSLLAEMLTDTLSIDPYMQSMAYIKMTARKGLRGYKGVNATVLFSPHPNCDQTYIIYPLNVAKSALDILDLANILKQSGKKVEVIRLNHADVNYLTQHNDGRPHQEKVLDYTYPVHIVRTQDLVEKRGPRFLKYRNKINAIQKLDIEIKSLSFIAEEKEILKDVATQWASIRFPDHIEENAMFIFHAIAHLVDKDEVRGLIACVEKQPVGFTLWEMPLRGKKVANATIHCALYERGLSELLHYEMAKSLYNDGVEYLCLGGAETEGLDKFKRKMNPVSSIELVTITL